MPELLSAPSILPDTAILEITGRCSHACLFCSCPWYGENQRTPEDLSTKEWKGILRELSRNGVSTFSFSGGDCTLRKDFRELASFAAGLSSPVVRLVGKKLQTVLEHPRIIILSNGRHLDSELLHFLKKLNASLNISLPGLTAFPELTGTGRPAAEVLTAIREAAAIGLHPTAAVTVTALNFFELYETLAAALLNGAEALLVNRFLPGGRGLRHPELNLNLEQVRQIPVIAEQVLTKARRRGYTGTEYPLCLADPRNFEYLKISTRCAAATGFFVVGPDGWLRVCNYSTRRLCRWQDWPSLQHNPYWTNYACRQNRPAECVECPDFPDCDGGCRECAAEFTGSPKGRDPVFSHPPFQSDQT